MPTICCCVGSWSATYAHHTSFIVTILEVVGTGFSNKGAELMLAAIVARKNGHWPDIDLAISPHSGPYERRARYGLLQMFRARKAGRIGWLIDCLMHPGYRQPYGLVREDEVDGVLDASGYALGDSWRVEWMVDKANRYERLRKEGKKIILLPQAIGPLVTTAARDAARRVLSAADLVFPRDPKSLEAALSVSPMEKNLFLAPDFTCLLPGMCHSAFTESIERVAIIPNSKMILSGTADSEYTYLKFLARCVDEVARAGMNPFILLHEDEEDANLAAQLVESAQYPLNVVAESDPLLLKGIISSCSFVVSSRFHGSVNALSQAVPCVGTSWSHKYRYLFEDYGVGELLIDQSESLHDGLRLVRMVLDRERREEIRKRLVDPANRQKGLAEAMWARVEDELR